MPNPIGLSRGQLSSFLKDHQSIRAFEKMLADVGVVFPETIEEAATTAASALAIARAALAALGELADQIERLRAPPQPIDPPADDTRPALALGTIAEQNHDAVAITGGRIGLDAGTVGAPSYYLAGESTTGFYRVAADSWGLAVAGVNLVTYSSAAITFAKPIISTVATGTAPFTVASTTLVPNLHAAVADSAGDLGTASSYPANATDLSSVIALANAMKSILITRKV